MTGKIGPKFESNDIPRHPWIAEFATYARVILFALGLGLVWLILTAPDQPSEPTPIWTTLPACTSEDQTSDCFWDAQTNGNHEGRSFYVLDGRTIYLDPVTD